MPSGREVAPEVLEQEQEKMEWLFDAVLDHIKWTTKDGRHDVDFDLLVRQPEELARIVELYTSIISKIHRERTIDNLAFIKKNSEEDNDTLGAILLSGIIATDRDVWMPYVIVDLNNDIPHKRIKIGATPPDTLGTVLADRNFALVTDVISDGERELEGIKTLESFGASVTDVIAVMGRTDLFRHNPEVQKALQDRPHMFIHYPFEAKLRKNTYGVPVIDYGVNQSTYNLLVATKQY